MKREAPLTLESKVAFLRRCDAYPDHPSQVTAIQTHMSWVFVTARYAYKLKKPMRRGTLDYHTLAARLRNCRREIELNRRLAPDVYLGVVPLTRSADGRLHVDGVGRVVDWLVKMRRLPEEGTLQNAIRHGRVDEARIRRVAVRLVAFFFAAANAATTPEAYCRHFDRLIRDTHRALLRPAYGLPRELIGRLAEAQLDFLAANSSLVGARASRVVEGHGDLRPEHVHLAAEPIVTDCLEFDRDLRLLDPVDELAFLGMECERLGAPAVGDWLLSSYRAAAGDDVAAVLVDFYACCRACLRARLAAWHLDEPGMRGKRKWLQRAGRYLAVASRHAQRLQAPDAQHAPARIAADPRTVTRRWQAALRQANAPRARGEWRRRTARRFRAP